MQTNNQLTVLTGVSTHLWSISFRYYNRAKVGTEYKARTLRPATGNGDRRAREKGLKMGGRGLRTHKEERGAARVS